VTYAWWPLFDLRLAAPDLTLRPMREADLATVATMLPEDAEQDPRATRYADADARLSRGIIAHQSLLGRLGNLAAPLPRHHGWPGYRRPGIRGHRLPGPSHGRHVLVPDPAGAGPRLGPTGTPQVPTGTETPDLATAERLILLGK